MILGFSKSSAMLFGTVLNTLTLVNCYICLNSPNSDLCQENCEIHPDMQITSTIEKLIPDVDQIPRELLTRFLHSPEKVDDCPKLIIGGPHAKTEINTEERILEYAVFALSTLADFRTLWKDTEWTFHSHVKGLGNISIAETHDYGKLWSFSMDLNVKPCELILDVGILTKNPTLK